MTEKELDTLKLESRRAAARTTQVDATITVKDQEIRALREQLRRAGESKWEGAVREESLESELKALRSNADHGRYQHASDSQQVQQLQTKIAKMDKYRAKLESSLADALYELKAKKAEVDRLHRTVSALIDRTELQEAHQRDTSLLAYRASVPSNNIDADIQAPRPPAGDASILPRSKANSKAARSKASAADTSSRVGSTIATESNNVGRVKESARRGVKDTTKTSTKPEVPSRAAANAARQRNVRFKP